ncbi:MAG: hypothetical protein M1838_005645 [Thelocarpon superellum]|nr:MAG: hypothetical protein M1838_005645 [Thelocarpon superellum]
MNPHQKNKIDISSLSEEEQKVFRLYGKLPNKRDLIQNKLKERKYFDSGDYALSKAGKASDVGVTQMGTQHPVPENIPHLTSPGPNTGSGNGNGAAGLQGPGVPGGSPVKESSFLHRQTSVDEQEPTDTPSPSRLGNSVSPPPIKEGVPLRWQS